MNRSAIGVSCDSHHSSVCLQEAGPSGPILSMITDGYRPLIPVSVGGGDSWGSAAVAEGCRIRENEDAPDKRFIGFLIARIWRHLGASSKAPASLSRSDPGRPLILAAPAGACPAVRNDLRQAFDEGGASVRSVISAPEALLAAGIHEIHGLSQTDTPPRLVTAICVGDQATEVATYRATPSSSPPGFQMNLAGPPTILRTGARKWIERVAEMVVERTTAHGRPLAGVRLLALHDAVLDFCDRLRRQAPGTPLPWDGPLHHQAFTDLSFTRRDCTTLPGASGLQKNLPQALREATSAGDEEWPSQIVLGGPGALFGVVQETCQGLGLPLIELRRPELAMARGASLWLDFQNCITQAPDTKAHSSREPASEPLPQEIPSNPIPPWLRA